MKGHATRLCIVMLLFVVGFISIPMQEGHAGNEIKVFYNGSRIVFSSQPVQLGGNTYVETRPFIQSLGLQVAWTSKTKFKLTKPQTTIEMELNNSSATINGSKITLSAVPTLRGSKLFLPVRPIATILNLTLNWNAATKTVELASRTTTTTPPTPSVPSSSYRIIGYYPSWALYQNYDVSQIGSTGLTHLNYAFANIKNGQVVLGDPAADQTNFDRLTKLKKAKPGLKTLISVGGWGWSGQFSDVAASIYSRNLFADSVVSFIRKYGFDGVDIDWEYPVAGGLSSNKVRPEDKTNFTMLLKAIRDKLNAAGTNDGKKYLLTIAVGVSEDNIRNIETAKLNSLVDWINLMTYDYHGNWDQVSGHQAPLYADLNDAGSSKGNIDYAVNTYLKAGASAKKLIVGIPFYGRSWTGCGQSNHGLDQSCKGVADGVIADGIHEYGNLISKGWINGQGYVRYWDNNAKVPWLFNSSTGTMISYEDPESITYKAAYIKAKGLGGAMAWELSQDSKNALLNKLVQALK
ncbi:chitinase [Cohnella endophytica]|uniref:chitinase n=1 Tax=Cohnella endophytica TaxID=2419778 RepID=A0A494Y0R7_9BACL|nr:glycosyl hydrolase family 18 protein [Cohnella endophytica]RKP54017.1 chitinase [Cohnella endophytica]